MIGRIQQWTQSGTNVFYFGRILLIQFLYIQAYVCMLSVVCFFLFEFWQILSLTELVYFIYVIKFVGTELFIVFLYYPLNVHRICSDVPAFISDISSLYWVFFGLARVIDFTVFFQGTNFAFTNFFLLISWSNFYYFFSSFYFGFHCSSFSSFLWRRHMITFRSFLFSNICLQCYKFYFKYNLCWISPKFW